MFERIAKSKAGFCERFAAGYFQLRTNTHKQVKRGV